MVHNKCPSCNKQPQEDAKEQQYYANRSAIEYSTTFSTQSAVSGHLPETSIETTSRWPRNRHKVSGRTTVPADFVERLGDGAVDWDAKSGGDCQRYPEPPNSDDCLIFDPFRGTGMLHFGYGETAP